MTAPCHTPLSCPAFHARAGECGAVNHNLVMENGGLAGGDAAVSAALIQIYGEARVQTSDGKTAGWWGSEFLDFQFGSRLHAVDGNDAAAVESALRDAFRPLIAAGLYDAVMIRAVETVSGPRVEIDASKDGVSLFEVKI